MTLLVNVVKVQSWQERLCATGIIKQVHVARSVVIMFRVAAAAVWKHMGQAEGEWSGAVEGDLALGAGWCDTLTMRRGACG